MDVDAASYSGLFGPFRRFADGVFGSLEDRLELLSIELHEEKQRLIQLLSWVFALFFAGTLAIAFASVAVVIAVWDTGARMPVVIGIASLYAGVALFAGLKLRSHLRGRPRPFAATINELKNDRRCLSQET